MSLSPIVAGVMGLGAGVVAGVGVCVNAAMNPASLLFGTTFPAPRRPHEIALTFDDGPNPAWTPRLLDLLAEFNVRATFFLIGRYAKANPAIVQRTIAEGHAVGNHSWSHPSLALQSAEKIRRELAETNHALAQITGQPVRWFRPPFGARRPVVLRAAQELSLEPVLWNSITTDWSERSADRIASRHAAKIERNSGRGLASNVVLHDGGHLEPSADRGPSVAAVRLLLERFQSTHKFVLLDDWINAR